MKWPWQDGNYNMRTHLDYAVTKCQNSTGFHYFAWHGKELLATVGTFAEAEGICVGHSERAAA